MTTREKMNYLESFIEYLESKKDEELTETNKKDLAFYKELKDDLWRIENSRKFAKVSQLENKNQFTIETNEGVFFQSYSSLCAKVSSDGLTLGRDWDYSHTTLKHLYIFLDNYCYSVYTMIEGSKNKRATLQKMIDDGIINYDEEMR